VRDEDDMELLNFKDSERESLYSYFSRVDTPNRLINESNEFLHQKGKESQLLADLPNELKQVVETQKNIKPLKHEGTVSTLENNTKSSAELRAELFKIMKQEDLKSIEEAIHVNINK
jgi:hypothetical protein